ncbi:MAG: FAD-dependent oxidoreductase, partial [Bacillota bacterium]
MDPFEWPYPVEWDRSEVMSADVLVIGGGVAGCWAAISSARRGARVVLMEKGATIRSGAGGTGCDHWENAATNPCCIVSPEELLKALTESHGGYYNGISHYIECREGYDRLLDLEGMGGKIRDTDDEFEGAEFRDPETKLLFAYDYTARQTLRVWGTTFKPALYRECKRLGVQVVDRTMATSLLARREEGGRIVGATGVHCRTGRFLVVQAKATVLCTSRPTRVWLFDSDLPGLCEFRPPQCTGDGHVMAWRAGAEFAMMEKSVRAQYSAAGRSYPAYGAGNPNNTWYACTMIDAEGREIPWVDRDGRELSSASDRHRPAPGQRFFLNGGSVEIPPYEYRGPNIIGPEEIARRGYTLPLFSDLSRMPDSERRAIWGLMVGQEARTA